MKLQHCIRVAAISVCACRLGGQTAIDLSRQARLESGSQLPATPCKTGRLFLNTSTSQGANLYLCDASNTWSAVAAYTAGTGIAIAGATVATEDAMVPIYYAGAGAPTITCVTGRDFFIDSSAGSFYFCKGPGQWQQVSMPGHTHNGAEIASGTINVSRLPATVPLTGQPNTFSAGQRQSFSQDGNNAGLQLTPAAGDPANARDGDLWYNSITGKFRRRQNGAAIDWDARWSALTGIPATFNPTPHNLLSLAHGDTAPAAAMRGDLITGQGSPAAWTRLGLGTAGSYLRSNGTDLAYASIALGDLPAGYSWTSLANVPATFTPSGHAATHLSNGSDPIAAATPSVRGTVTTTTSTSQTVSTDDPRMSNARTPTAHAATHQNGGSDEISTSIPAANAIPKAGSGGTLAAGWLPTPSATTPGGVQSKDCTGTGHVLKINTDGSVTCSADVGSGGGVTTGSTLPATCSPATSNLYFLTSGSVGLYQCMVTNTWTQIPSTGGSNPPWNGVAGPAGNAALAMAAYTTTWTWGTATGPGTSMFALTDGVGNTGTGYLFDVNLASGSAAKPGRFAVDGNGVGVSNAGLLSALGSGGISATHINGTLLSGLATGLLKNTYGTGAPGIAVSGADYAPATNGTSGQPLTSNGAGGFGPPITTGTTAQYFRGDFSLATFPTIAYQAVQANTAAQTPRSNLNFSGNFNLSDSSANNRTTVDLAGTINANTSGNAATATTLAATPTQCTSGQFAIGVTANGNANCGTPSGGSSSDTLLDHAGQQSETPLTTSTDNAIYTYTISGGTIPAGKCVEVTLVFAHTTGTASLTPELYFGTTTFGGGGWAAAGTGKYMHEFRICNRMGATNAQDIYLKAWVSTMVPSSSTIATTTATQDTTANVTLKYTFNPGTNTGQGVTLYSAETEVLR